MKNVSLTSIGINQYDQFQTLGLCSTDAQSIKNAFDIRFPEISSTIINDETNIPTSDSLNRNLEEIGNLSYSDSDIVIFFYAGHGFATDGKDFICTRDTCTDDLDTAICTDIIIDKLKKSGAGNIILIIDACRTELSRNVNNFGERTAEFSRRKGVVSYFSCSPGETAKELSVLNGGIFTTAFSALLSNLNIPFTPFQFNRDLIESVGKVCIEHNLEKQTPYTAVAPLEKATYDVFSDKRFDSNIQNKEMILVLGPSNAGKTTIGQHLAQKHSYIHAEMSSFAWKRFNECEGFTGSILDFMECEVWSRGNEDVIAQDLIESNNSNEKIVICGARRIEEIETLLSQGWDVKTIFVFANAIERYTRIQHSSGRYGPNYEEFIKKDLKELSWGIAGMIQIKDAELIVNESNLDDCLDKVSSFINPEI